MNFKKLAKLSTLVVLAFGMVAAGNSTVPVTAQAQHVKSAKVIKVKTKKITKRAVHVKKGTFYTSSKLNKVKASAKRYQHTTFYTYKQAKAKRANGKTVTAYYLKSQNKKVKGWILKTYVKNGKAVAKKVKAKKITQQQTTTTEPVTNTTESKEQTKQPETPAVTPNNPSTGGTTPVVPVEQVKISVSGPISEGNKTLASGTVAIKDGDMVSDVLQRLCEQNNLDILSSGQGGSFYVRGIGGYSEFDKGATSGWVCKVNGVFPQTSLGVVPAKNGDVIEWLYTEAWGDRGDMGF